MKRKMISGLCALLVCGSALLSLGFQDAKDDPKEVRIEALRHFLVLAIGDRQTVELHTIHGSFATGVPQKLLIVEDLVHLKTDKGDTYLVLSNVESLTVHRKRD